MPLEARLDELPAGQRAAAQAVLAHLATLGPMIVEAVGVGVLVKRSRTFIELRPKRSYVTLSFIVGEPIRDRRIARTIAMSGGRCACFVDLREAADVDATLRRWLTASYRATAP